MPSVWYIGSSTERKVSAADWEKVGLIGGEFVWSTANGWSVDRGWFSTEQLIYLVLDGYFWIDAPSGPRLWDKVPPGYDGTPPTVIANQLADIAAQTLAASAMAKSVADRITVSTTAPPNPSIGDVWIDTGGV